jgi:Zinc finger, ZZ type
MVVPPEAFAGSDLLQLEMESFEATTEERKQTKARFFPAAKTIPVFPEQQIRVSDEIPSDAVEIKIIDVTPVPFIQPETATIGVWEEDSDVNRRITGFPGSAPEGTAVEGVSGAREGQDMRNADPDNVSDQGSSTFSAVAQPPFPTQGPFHPGVSCDSCGMPSIIGVRWKCLVCETYDLCTDCRSSGKCTNHHSVEHRVLRIETPQSMYCFDVVNGVTHTLYSPTNCARRMGM